MFILYAILAGLVVGRLSGGRFLGLARIQFRWGALILLGFIAQIVLFTDAVASRVGDAGPVLYVASTLLVGIAVVRNLALPGMPLIVAGALSNMAAILANGGYMPAAPGAIASLGSKAPTIYSNSAIVPQPALEPLTDLFALPRWVPFANVFSVGDILLGVGAFVLVVVAMRAASVQEPSTETAPEASPEPRRAVGAR